MMFSKRVLLCLVLVASTLWSVPVFALETGIEAPGFALKSVNGEEIALADFKGRVVLLKLATTWCPTCKQLSGEIDKVGAALKEKDVAYLEVFVQDSVQMVKDYVEGDTPPMTFHALLDDGQVYKAYNVYLIPRLLLIDADQIIRFDSSGRNVAAEDILRMVEEASPAEESVEPPQADQSE